MYFLIYHCNYELEQIVSHTYGEYITTLFYLVKQSFYAAEIAYINKIAMPVAITFICHDLNSRNYLCIFCVD